jgi:hypothetical protein
MELGMESNNQPKDGAALTATKATKATWNSIDSESKATTATINQTWA